MGSYSLIDHTADIGVELRAENRAGLFYESIRALFFILTGKDVNEIHLERKSLAKRKAKIKYDNLDDALIDFLNHLVFVVDTEHILPCDGFIKIKRHSIRSRVAFLKDNRHLIQREVKAATFHNFKIEKYRNGLKTRITFDI